MINTIFPYAIWYNFFITFEVILLRLENNLEERILNVVYINYNQNY